MVCVCALTTGDYLLWNWSLSGNREVLALVSGLTLPPLAAACLLLVALTGARLASRVTRRSLRPALARRSLARAGPYVSPARPIGARAGGTSQPDVALEGAGARGRAVQDHGELDDSGRPATAVGGRSARPARKVAA